MENQIKIEDHSGDKKYFSQLPHYILNHSTAIDQALYWQMKRYSGETGKCFATQETLMKKMGIGRKAFNKSLKYLLDKGWVKFIGKTEGRTRPINTYAIVDIWKLNILHYEEIPAKRTVSIKEEIPAERTGDTGQKSSKIPARRTVEEEPSKEEHNNNTISDKKVAKVKNKVGLLVDYYFKLKEWDNQPRSFYEENGISYGRNCRASKDVLTLCDDSLEKAKKMLDKVKDWADINALEWTLETVSKKFLELCVAK